MARSGARPVGACAVHRAARATAAPANTLGAVVTGLVVGAVCAFAVTLKYRFGVDDTLDAMGVHGVGGLIGLIMVGLFATARISGKKGLFCGGGWGLLGKQLVVIVSVMAFSFILTWIIAKVVHLTVGFRAQDEYGGVPGTERERAYDFQTAERLGALVSGKAVTSDDELVREITKLLRAREEAK
ncbi:hypothetical protein PUR34_30185 [Streptomyces sp. JV185]|uniref:hypothetical protein n=1 Tax=Streptomyces sp. JV185 TaxID=858638 RepID=UPI002E79D5D8|nr:hypothetical protein [Streptomyces sp. JV185]MEE1772323.1 hypothetical protein [Streptomyces sp. JV185]